MRNNPNWLKFIHDQYSPGTRIRPTQMDDPYAPIPSGTEGTVDFVDDAGQIHMKWDNGRSLALIPGVDSFTKIAPPLQTFKLYVPLTVTQYEQNEGGGWDEYPSELNEDTSLAYQDQILAAILKERMPEETERSLMKYYHKNKSVNEKVQSLRCAGYSNWLLQPHQQHQAAVLKWSAVPRNSHCQLRYAGT
ncbi:hypothetical protein MASR2M70_17320 [Bacillota bacterium]